MRVIKASYFGSNSMLKALADAQDRNVPEVRKRNVRVEVERVVLVSAIVVVVDRISEMG